MNKREKISLGLNIAVFLMAIVGSILCFGEIQIIYSKPIEHGIKLLKFFTIQSNIFAGIMSMLYIIFAIREQRLNKQMPKIIYILKYIATIDLIITFLVVALFLGFITDEGYFSLYVNANFFFHFAIPLINFVCFVWFDKSFDLKIKHTFIGLSHILLYSVFYISVVLSHITDGVVPLEFDWYGFAQKGIGVAFVCAIVVLAVGYLTSFLLYKAVKKRQDRI